MLQKTVQAMSDVNRQKNMPESVYCAQMCLSVEGTERWSDEQCRAAPDTGERGDMSPSLLNPVALFLQHMNAPEEFNASERQHEKLETNWVMTKNESTDPWAKKNLSTTYS